MAFVRTDFGSLGSYYRFQLYHELAHGTPGGVDLFIRELRWRFSAPIASRMILVLLACVLASGATEGRIAGPLMSAALLLLGTAFRTGVRQLTEKTADAAPEAFADAVALGHPDFLEDSAWKIRAANLAASLDDELEELSPDDPRRFSIRYRAFYLRRWLDGQDRVYVTTDVHPGALLGFLLLVAAGWKAQILPALSTILYVALFLAGAISQRTLGLNARDTDLLNRSLDRALREHENEAGGASDPESAGSVPPAATDAPLDRREAEPTARRP